MDYRTQLITLAETLSAATGRSVARIATLAANRGSFFDDLRAGKGCTVDTYLAVKAWFAAHWPAGLDWPAGVDPVGVLPAAVSSAAQEDVCHQEVA